MAIQKLKASLGYVRPKIERREGEREEGGMWGEQKESLAIEL